MNIHFEENEIAFQPVDHPACAEKKVRLSIARLDRIHPIVSGNKLFKLHYFLEEALGSGKDIITFGGAYSNHLVAAAYAAQQCGIKATGIVRGEMPEKTSSTLQLCREYGMQLQFISRDAYKNIHDPAFIHQLQTNPASVIIPEGGYHPLGAEGAALIMPKIQMQQPTHICVAVGTATTLAGLVSAAKEGQQIIGFPAIKNMTDIDERLSALLNGQCYTNYEVAGDYHFGGYARSTPELIAFMNTFYQDYHVPLDFVYTAKMLFGTIEKIRQGHFAEGSNIICLHTGGLQGNNSFPAGTLVY